MNGGPVFVTGLERSGTSLMFALLASHPSLAMTRRTNLWRYFNGQYGDLADDANLTRCLELMRRYKRLVVLDPDWNAIEAAFRAGERTYGRLFWLIEQQHADRLGRPRWGDKSLNTERHADGVFAAYPDARFVHMIRDPRDRYASSETRWRVRRGGVGAGTAEWLESVRLADRNIAEHPGAYLVVQYEHLVSAPEETMRAVCEFIGEPYVSQMLAMDGAERFRDQGANSSYDTHVPPGSISTGSVGRYRTVLAPAKIAYIEHVAGREMVRLGYEVDAPHLGTLRAIRYRVSDIPVESLRLVAWRLRSAREHRKGEALPDYRLVECAGAEEKAKQGR